MLTIREAARVLGTTERGARLRVDALRPEITPHLRRGRNGALLLTDSAMALLQRLEDVRRGEGLTVRLAAERVRRELLERVAGTGQGGATPRNDPPGEVAALRELVEELRRQNERLWALLNERLAALPAPGTRRPWWWRLARIFGG